MYIHLPHNHNIHAIFVYASTLLGHHLSSPIAHGNLDSNVFFDVYTDMCQYKTSKWDYVLLTCWCFWLIRCLFLKEGSLRYKRLLQKLITRVAHAWSPPHSLWFPLFPEIFNGFSYVLEVSMVITANSVIHWMPHRMDGGWAVQLAMLQRSSAQQMLEG